MTPGTKGQRQSLIRNGRGAISSGQVIMVVNVIKQFKDELYIHNRISGIFSCKYIIL